MGGCASVPDNTAKTQTEANRNINRDIATDRRKVDREVKFLLLGAGESGKSTIAKQMRILHQKNPFDEEELSSYKSIVYSNTISSMRILVEAARDLGIAIQPSSLALADQLLTKEEYYSENFDEEVGELIRTLWKDEGIRATYARSSEFQLNDSAGYFFDNIDRLISPNYEPNEEDVIRARAKTTGIIETKFEIDDDHYRIVDVGGQRSERKKWMHCFQDVTAVIFCVAMSEYDLTLYEDDSTNRMHESLKVFQEILSNKWFGNTTIMLFLNKKDLFAKKIVNVDLKVCFPEYTGGKTFEPAANFMRLKFEEVNDVAGRQIYSHLTCATDRDQINHVFDAVRQNVVQKAFMDSGYT